MKPKGGRTRWRDGGGRIYEWDKQHGAVEVYDSRGHHLGEYDHVTGNRLKPADPARRIEP
jgi:Cytotoxic